MHRNQTRQVQHQCSSVPGHLQGVLELTAGAHVLITADHPPETLNGAIRLVTLLLFPRLSAARDALTDMWQPSCQKSRICSEY